MKLFIKYNKHYGQALQYPVYILVKSVLILLSRPSILVGRSHRRSNSSSGIATELLPSTLGLGAHVGEVVDLDVHRVHQLGQLQAGGFHGVYRYNNNLIVNPCILF